MSAMLIAWKLHTPILVQWVKLLACYFSKRVTKLGLMEGEDEFN